MKIAILSRDETLYSSRRLRDEAAARGHVVQIPPHRRFTTVVNRWAISMPLSRASATPLPFTARQCCDSLRCAAAIP